MGDGFVVEGAVLVVDVGEEFGVYFVGGGRAVTLLRWTCTDDDVR